jgi:hypothetical protein
MKAVKGCGDDASKSSNSHPSSPKESSFYRESSGTALINDSNALMQSHWSVVINDVKELISY